MFKSEYSLPATICYHMGMDSFLVSQSMKSSSSS